MSDSSILETLLASSVHDMKNSLTLLLGQLDSMSSKLEQDDENKQSVFDLRYQANRINLSLMELLTLYKLEKNQVNINIDEVFLIDFLEDCVASNLQLATNKSLNLNIDCEDTLVWFFDPDLVSVVINNIIGNCLRYTETQVLVSAKIENGLLLIQIDDDGQGYPENMLLESSQYRQKVDFSKGNTGLGLYFSAVIANEHQRQNKQGSIHLKNNNRLCGSSFQIKLP